MPMLTGRGQPARAKVRERRRLPWPRDLSWLLSVAARPSMQARYPQAGRDLQRPRRPGGPRPRLLGRRRGGDVLRRDAGPGPARRRGAFDAIRTLRALACHRGAVATVPLGPRPALREPRGSGDCSSIASAGSENPPTRCASYLDLLAGRLGSCRRHVATGAAPHRRGRSPRSSRSTSGAVHWSH